MFDRRDFLKSTTAAGAAAMLGGGWTYARAFYQTPSLIPLFGTTLRGVGPGGIPVAAPDAFKGWGGAVHYTMNVKQYQDDGVVPTLGTTTLWGYDPAIPLGPLGRPQPQRHLGGIIIGKKGKPIQITFNNLLGDASAANGGKHIIPNDLTIMGADLGNFRLATHFHGGEVPWISDGGPHTWFAPNLYPDPKGNYYGPSADLGGGNNIYKVINPNLQPGQAEVYYPLDQSARFGWYHDHAFGITRINAYAGVASGIIIRDDQEADLVKNAGLPPYIENSVLNPGTWGPVRELPLVIQDKIFVGPGINSTDPNSSWKTDPNWKDIVAPIAQQPGSLWYAHEYETPARWDQGPTSRTLPNPSVIPEFFGDTMLVNGTAYPTANVEPRRYRLRLLNACSARFLNLQLYVADTSSNGITLDGNGKPTNDKFLSKLYGGTGSGSPQLLQIGTEGGFLANPALIPTNLPFDPDRMTGSLVVAPAERPDIIIDFSAMAGKKIILYNDAPAPFPMGDPLNDYFPGLDNGNPVNASTTAGYGPNTRVLMSFVVGNSVTAPADQPLRITTTTKMPGIDPSIKLDKPANLVGAVGKLTPTPPFTPKQSGTNYAVRRLTLNEGFDEYGRLIQMLGTTTESSPGFFGRAYDETPTEVVRKDDVEVWEVFNTTGDVHPMHWHLVNVQVVNRQPLVENSDGSFALGPTGAIYSGPAMAPNANELGWKETVPMYPGTVTRVAMKFKLPGTPFKVPPSPRTGGNEYVWHCHILEHEEHDMMRPLIVKT
jgi:spore coat protein A